MQKALLAVAGLTPTSLLWSRKGCPCSQSRHAGVEDLLPHPLLSPLHPSWGFLRWAGWKFVFRLAHRHHPSPHHLTTTLAQVPRPNDLYLYFFMVGGFRLVREALTSECTELAPLTGSVSAQVPGG